MRYRLYKTGSMGPDTTPSVDGIMSPACDDGLGGREANTLFIRGIPVVIEPGTAQTYNAYKLELEALDAGGGVTDCVINPARTVRPGDNSIVDDESLSPGACP
jgi:hypothetical protein